MHSSDKHVAALLHQVINALQRCCIQVINALQRCCIQVINALQRCCIQVQIILSSIKWPLPATVGRTPVLPAFPSPWLPPHPRHTGHTSLPAPPTLTSCRPASFPIPWLSRLLLPLWPLRLLLPLWPLRPCQKHARPGTHTDMHACVCVCVCVCVTYVCVCIHIPLNSKPSR